MTDDVRAICLYMERSRQTGHTFTRLSARVHDLGYNFFPSRSEQKSVIMNRIADWLQNHMTYDTRSVYYYPIPPFLFWRQVHPDPAWVMTIKRGRAKNMQYCAMKWLGQQGSKVEQYIIV